MVINLTGQGGKRMKELTDREARVKLFNGVDQSIVHVQLGDIASFGSPLYGMILTRINWHKPTVQEISERKQDEDAKGWQTWKVESPDLSPVGELDAYGAWKANQVATPIPLPHEDDF